MRAVDMAERENGKTGRRRRRSEIMKEGSKENNENEEQK